ncbi:YncE family protein [Methylobacterium durans]|uniref:YVTN family beta-propeller repeat protein n=1 Tax=Methylobacterium durans TaxID=2202825 RepID=UPI002AFFDE26|nr:cytochrome D1 domain-containing protein [Methylobacterium durans]MEA1834403.1 YncE family protein [Methylobacterium durans]
MTPGSARAAAFVAACLCLPPGLGRAETAIYVASQEAGAVTRVDGEPGSGPVTLGAGPAGLAAAPDGTLYLTHPEAAAITVVGPDGRILRRLPFRGQPFGIAVSADGMHLFVGDWQGGTVSRVDALSGAVEAATGIGREPAGLVIDAAGRVFVAERGGDSVSVLDGGTMERRAGLLVGRAPFALALSPDGDRLYVGNVRSNDLTVIDARALTVLATVPAGRSPYGVATSRDGGEILVTNQESGSVSILDRSLALRGEIPVGRYPEGVAVAGHRAYVANWFSNDVSVIDLGARREIERRKVPEGPRAVVAAPVPRRGEAGR